MRNPSTPGSAQSTDYQVLGTCSKNGTRYPNDETGKAICLDWSTLTPIGDNQYDLGPSGLAKFNMLSDHEYFATANFEVQVLLNQKVTVSECEVANFDVCVVIRLH